MYQEVFRACPSNYLILYTDEIFTIVDVSNFHESLLGRKREDLVGKGLFECYPENPQNNWDENGLVALKSSMQKVVKEGTTQVVQLRYDVPVNDGFEFRYWEVKCIPIFMAGVLMYILNTSYDITQLYKNGFKI